MKVNSGIAKMLVVAGVLVLANGAFADDCNKLNEAYVNRYISEFSIDTKSFEIDTARMPIFKCDGFDKNFILARAIHDLDQMRTDMAPNSPNNFYSFVSGLLSRPNTKLRYAHKPKRNKHFTAAVRKTEHWATIFLTTNYVRSAERLRPTYVLVHEAAHLRENDPGHVVCGHGEHAGRIACDRQLGDDTILRKGSGNSYEYLFLKFVLVAEGVDREMLNDAILQIEYLESNLFDAVE